MYVCMLCMYVNLPMLQLEFKGGVLGIAGMMGNNLVLTHMFLVDTSIIINGRNPFLNLGCLVYIFHFYSISNRNSLSKQCRS